MDRDRCELLCIDFETAERLRTGRLEAAVAEFASGLARSLGDVTRLQLARALADVDELCVCDLAWIVERPQSLVSHHLRLMRSDGLLVSRRDKKFMKYSLAPAARIVLAALLPDRSEAPA